MSAPIEAGELENSNDYTFKSIGREDFGTDFCSQPVKLGNGKIALPDLNRVLRIFDGVKPVLLSEFKLPGAVGWTPVLVRKEQSDKNEWSLVMGTSNGHIIFYRNGKTLTTSKVSDSGLSGIAVRGEKMVFGSGNGTVFFMNYDGTPYRFPIRVKGAIEVAPTILQDGTVVVSTVDGPVYFIDKDNSYKCIEITGQPTSAVQLKNGTVLVGCLKDGQINNTRNNGLHGELLFLSSSSDKTPRITKSIEFDSPIGTKPFIFKNKANEENILVATMDGDLYVIDIEGNIKRKKRGRFISQVDEYNRHSITLESFATDIKSIYLSGTHMFLIVGDVGQVLYLIDQDLAIIGCYKPTRGGLSQSPIVLEHNKLALTLANGIEYLTVSKNTDQK